MNSIQKISRVLWPAFLTACMMEFVVFAAVDPMDVQLVKRNHDLSAYAVYGIGFLAFWLIGIIGSWLTLTLTHEVEH
jgi:hypothetical protein